jgi:hypothetical protein
MRKVLNFVTVFFVIGCALTTQKGHFDISNRSNSNIQLYIRGEPAGPVIGPNGISSFEVEVEVPTPAGGGTDPLDRTTSVKVQVKNLTTGGLSQETYCQAGAKIHTSVMYTYIPATYSGGYATDQISCSGNYSKAPVNPPLLAP